MFTQGTSNVAVCPVQKIKIHKCYRIELDPNNVQRTEFMRHAGAARFAYNWGLSQKQQAYTLGDKTPTAIDLHKELVVLKHSGKYDWLNEVSKCSPQFALRNLDIAFVNFFKHLSKFPKYKSRNKGIGSFTLDGTIWCEGGKVWLPKIGEVRTKERLTINTRITKATVSEKAGRWFVSLSTEVEHEVPQNTGPAIGLDLGLKAFIVPSVGQPVEAPKPLKRYARLLKVRQRKLSRCKKGSAQSRPGGASHSNGSGRASRAWGGRAAG